MPTINDLRNRAALIGNATQVGENTASRVGTTFEMVADLLDGMGVGQGILSIDLAQLNTLNTATDQTDANPTIYNVTTLHNLSSTTIKVGTLLVFSDGGRSVVTQVLFSNYQVDGGGNISSPNPSQITMYYRMYNIVQGTWSTWTLYAGGGGGGTIDPYPVNGSTNAVESNGVFERLQDAAPQVDIDDIDDVDDYSDMLAGKASYYTITKSQGGNTYRIGTLMVFANHIRTALYQLLATDFDLDANGDIITNQSTNGGFKLLWRGKIFSGNVPDGWTLNQWSKWHYIIEPNYEDIDFDTQGRLQFADKMYEPTNFSGLGRFYIRKNIQNVGGVDKNVLTQAYMSEANFIYIIQYDFDLNGATINIPSGCVIEFRGGSIKNGVLNGTNTLFRGLTDDCLLCDFAGTFADIEINVGALGIHSSEANNQTNFDHLSSLISGMERAVLHFQTGEYLYGGFSNQPQSGTYSSARSIYNSKAIVVKTSAVTKSIKIFGNDATFKPTIPIYVGTWDYNGGTPVPNYVTDTSATWTFGGGWFYNVSTSLKEIYIESVNIDGGLDEANFGGKQYASQSATGIHCGSVDIAVIKNSTIYNNVTDGLTFSATKFVDVENTILRKNMRWGMSTGAAGRILVSNCVFEDNGKIYKVNEYYAFEGNHGDIDAEVTDYAPSRDIKIVDTTFTGTGGASGIVANNNVKSLLVDNCVFEKNFVSLGKSGADVIYAARYTQALNFSGAVIGGVSISNVRMTNYLFDIPKVGRIPTSDERPTDESNLYFVGNSLLMRSQISHIVLSYTEDCTGLDTTLTNPYETFVIPQAFNYRYSSSWSKVTGERLASHYGDADINDITINLCPMSCIGSNSAAAPSYGDTIVQNMVVNVYKKSPKPYFKNINSTNIPYTIFRDIVVNDFCLGSEAQTGGESIARGVGSTDWIYNKLDPNGNASIVILKNYANRLSSRMPNGIPVVASYTTRPSIGIGNGSLYYDESMQRPIFNFNGSWLDAKGFTCGITKGTTANRPVGTGGGGILVSSRDIGYEYFDTNLGKPVYAKAINATTGVVTWVDATGTVV